jgi:hypothetical protein
MPRIFDEIALLLLPALEETVCIINCDIEYRIGRDADEEE